MEPDYVRRLNVAIEKQLRVTVNGRRYRLYVVSVSHGEWRDELDVQLRGFPVKPRTR
jgi:hypothetical protein